MQVSGITQRKFFRGTSLEDSTTFIFKVTLENTKHLAKCKAMYTQLEKVYVNFRSDNEY